MNLPGADPLLLTNKLRKLQFTTPLLVPTTLIPSRSRPGNQLSISLHHPKLDKPFHPYFHPIL
jgi:hypothetical protein